MLSRISIGGLIAAALIQGVSAQTAAVPDFSSASAGWVTPIAGGDAPDF